MNQPTPQEARASKRFMIVNLIRLASVLELAAGMAIAREVIAAPYILGVVLAVSGLASFFFGPYLLTKYWKAQDSEPK